MAKHTSLGASKKSKQDEFYTLLSDIEKELNNYRHHFKDKVVFCNCDDPEHSNFWWYFKLNFDFLGLKKLITTHYHEEGPTYKLVIDGTKRDKDGNPVERKTALKGNGDFRSDESIAILKESDIVVTNPPFSLFPDFVMQMMAYNKKFLIIGNLNATTYAGVFPYVKRKELFWGVTRNGSGQMWFMVPDYVPDKKGQKIEDGKKYQTIGNTVWFTNLDHNKRHDDLILVKSYYKDPEAYPKYENYDAIAVEKVVDIPMDYEGVMGVPVTFLGKHSHEQFEIVGATESEGKGFSNGVFHEGHKVKQPIVNGVRKFKRLFIRNLKPQKGSVL